MSRATESADRDAVRVARSSRLREAVGLAVVAAALLAAILIVAGPALVDPNPETTQAISAAERGVSHRTSSAPVAGAAASPSSRRAGRVRPIAVQAGDARSNGSGDHRPAPADSAAAPQRETRASDTHLRGPLTNDRIARAIDRAVRRGWLTIDPPGSEPRGMALFPPMGTQPLRQGIVVPDGFELPPGYVRHYQVTDGGEQLRPILMFSPDYEWVNQRGEVVALPGDGIVTPDMAPEGMPIEMLELPPPPASWP